MDHLVCIVYYRRWTIVCQTSNLHYISTELGKFYITFTTNTVTSSLKYSDVDSFEIAHYLALNQ